MLLDDAAGTATWRDASVGGAAQAKLGALQATFAAAADGGVAGVVRDMGGPLEVAGTFRTSLGAYEAQGRLAARAGLIACAGLVARAGRVVRAG